MMKGWVWLLLLTMPLGARSSVPDAYLTVTVYDEIGNPLEGVTVQGYFTNMRYDYVPGPERIGLTDDKGVVKISGPALVSVNVEAAKEGYYKTEKEVVVNQQRTQSVSVLLRTKRNPVAMYAKQTVLSARSPIKSGETFGYDLVVGDFVTPYGKGGVSDLIITHTYSMSDFWNRESKIVIRFSNPDDGLLPFYLDKENASSEYKSAFTAPLEGYKNEWVLTSSRKGVGSSEEGNMDARRNYFLRVRSERDGSGNVVSGYYGKIYGEFPEVTYYLNPTPNDRNIEFNMKNNLFRNLKDEEHPRAP